MLGLRAKLALALIATSLLTLAAAVGTLLPPLQHRLAQDRVRDLRELARTAELGLARLPAADLRKGAVRPKRIVHQLARRTGGRVALFDAQGVELADTDPERPEPGMTDTPERLVDAGFARAGGVRQSVRDGEAIVVARVHTHAGLRTLVMRKSLGDQRAAVAVVRSALPVAGGVGVAIAVTLGALLGFGLLRRLERLRRDVRRLTEEGIGTPLAFDGAGTDEVGEVARALESMRARLHAQERGRQAFLSTASHELRTPVASLRGTAELLEEELRCADPDLGHARRRAAAVSRQAERLSALADDLLGLGRLDADIPLASEPVDLVELTGTLVGELEPVAQTGGVALSFASADEAWAVGDLLAIARIIRSLLDNGLRHGASPGSVLTVTVAAGDDVVTVAVRDAGDGVPEADRERIFGRFERAAAPGAGGFGLGLPIARGLARRMAGDVLLSALGPGACFTLTLPACASPVGVERSLGRHAPAAPAAPAR